MTKMVCGKDGVCETKCVAKMMCNKGVCETWCVTKLCVCDKVGCDKDVCCKDGVWE